MSQRVKALGGLLALGALAVALGPSAAAPAPAGKGDPKKAPARRAPRPPDLGELLRLMADGPDADDVEEMQAEMERLQLELLKALQRAMREGGRPLPGGAFDPFALNRMGRPPEPRLGVRVAKPDATLVDQLDLPRDRGLVLQEVRPNSPAARAGLKPHDILLELDGKPVPSRIEEFIRQLAQVQANKPVEAVVLRKGRKETIKGLSLPERRGASRFDGVP